MSSQSFADLGVSKPIVDALTRRGVARPFAVQRLVIADVLASRDVLVKSPTGSGKTLAFGIPLADRLDAEGPRPAALVLAPTRELASQIVAEIRDVAHSRALRVTAVYGGVGLTKQAAAAARSHILVATPGRLEDLLARGAFTLDRISILVLDEADRMLDMGFRPAVDRIVAACPKRRQTLFFSATLDGAAGQVADRYTHQPVTREHVPPPSRAAEIEHRFMSVRGDQRVDALVAELARERELALVFVRTKRGADRLVKRLATNGIGATAIHGNKSQGQRERALADFQARRIDTLVATDLAARGIDVEGISHVINFDPPEDHEVYVHRIGRTGRAGRSGIGITLVAAEEREHMRKLAHRLDLAHGLGGEPTARGTDARRRSGSRSDAEAAGGGGQRR
ncbi:MAG: DEAD/DEAH box helicase, partial [Solirubrobacteraceae bacterium]